MRYFAYKDGVLHAEDLSLAALSAEVGTPFYCYSEATLRRHAQVLTGAFTALRPLIAYSVKANSNLAVLRVLASEGLGADVVSGGELRRARAAGIPANRIVFSGVGKTREEFALGLDEGIHQFNVESEPELLALNEVALGKGRRAAVAFRVNPDVKAGGHAKISTGKAEDKFGVPISEAPRLYAAAAALPGVEIVGVDCHIGSQIEELSPYDAAFRRLAELITTLRASGHAIRRLDIGGGLAAPYAENVAQASPQDYADLVERLIAPLDLELILEPGRVIAANAGALIATVLYVKAGEARTFLILDAAMNDLMRPALYDAVHDILPLRADISAARAVYDVVGPVCETTDIFRRGAELPALKAGDRVAIMTAGAYGAALSNQYNTRALTPEVLVSGRNHAIIRRRPNFVEMTALEDNAPWLDEPLRRSTP